MKMRGLLLPLFQTRSRAALPCHCLVCHCLFFPCLKFGCRSVNPGVQAGMCHNFLVFFHTAGFPCNPCDSLKENVTTVVAALSNTVSRCFFYPFLPTPTQVVHVYKCAVSIFQHTHIGCCGAISSA